MKAAFITQPGPATNLQYRDFPEPQRAAGQVIVQVGAVAVNPIDTYIRSGNVKMNIPLPYVVGCDLAGVVVEAGTESPYPVGTRVWGSNQGLFGRQGSFAERVAVDPQWLYPTPENVSDEKAAAGALVGITAWLGLFEHARLGAGETLFIHGGTGGVGSCVVQIAHALGATVITTAGTEEKLAICRQLGADEAFNYHTADLDAAVRRAVPEGLNVYWETQREPNLELAISWLAPRGRIILMAGREARPVLPVGPFYVRECSMHGFAMFNATPNEQRRAAEDLNRWLAAGQLQPRIDRVLPLSAAADAHQLQEENTLRQAGTLAGKIVLKPDATA